MTEPTLSLHLYSIYPYSRKADIHLLHIINKTLFIVSQGTSLKGIYHLPHFKYFLGISKIIIYTEIW